jgi:O-antigen ligase
VTALRVAAALLLSGALAGNIVRIPLFSSVGKDAPLLPLDLALGVILVVGLIKFLQRRRFALDVAALWGLAFVSVATVGLISAGSRVGVAMSDLLFAGAYLVRWSAYFMIFIIVGAMLPADDALPIGRLMRTGIVLFAAFGIVQSIFLPDFALVIHPGATPYEDWDPQRNRLVSTYLDPNYAGVLIVIGLCLWGGRLMAGLAPRWWEGALLGVALVLTLSRGSWLAAVCAIAAVTLAYGVSRRLLRLIAAAGVALLAALPAIITFGEGYAKFQIDRSALGRLIAWQRDLILISDYPMLGIGFNTLGFVGERYEWDMRGASSFGLDGGLLFIGALTGMAGLICFVALLWMIIRSAHHTLRDAEASPDDRAIAFAVVGSVVAVTIQATFANTLMLPLVLAPCWVLWALPRARRRAATSAR